MRTFDEVYASMNEAQRKMEALDASHRSEALPEAAQESYNQAREAYVACETELREIQLAEIASRDPELNLPPERRQGGPTPARRRRLRGALGEARDSALRAVDRHLAGALSSTAGDRLTQVIERDATGTTAAYIEAVSDPDYEAGFLRKMALSDGPGAQLSAAESAAFERVAKAEAQRAMSLGEGKLGAFAVPAQLDPSILLSTSGNVSPLRSLARVVTVVSSNIWNGISSEGVEASFDAEAAEVSDDSPELTQPEVKVEKASAWVPFSLEFGSDYAAAGQELARLLADAKAQLEAEKFLLGEGSGSHEPEGLVSKLASGSVVETATEKVFAAGDVYSVQESLGARFQDNASWLSSLTLANVIWRFSSPGGEEAALFNGDRTRLLGKAWHEASPMSTKAATQNAKTLLYGDFKQAYVIADRVGLSIELVPHLFGENRRPTGQRGYYAFWRVGGAPIVDNAARLLKVK